MQLSIITNTVYLYNGNIIPNYITKIVEKKCSINFETYQLVLR